MSSPVENTVHELRRFLDESSAATALALGAIVRLLLEMQTSMVPTEQNPNPHLYLGNGDPNDPATKVIPGYSRQDLAVELSKHGPARTRLSQQWLVAVYSGWDHTYRPQLAKLHQCEVNDVRVDLFGDIRLIRHDVVHCNGIATKENSGKAKQLGHWVTLGQPIRLDVENFAEVGDRFPTDRLIQGLWD